MAEEVDPYALLPADAPHSPVDRQPGKLSRTGSFLLKTFMAVGELHRPWPNIPAGHEVKPRIEE